MDRRRHPPVPTTASVLPGAAVNIVLKADQPTGRTVSGIVRDVLTRGNHPRGIKVRLADGRVGRVQSMASSSSTLTGAAPSTGSNFETRDVFESFNGALGDAQAVGLGFEGSSSSRGGRRSRRGGGRGGGNDDYDDQELPRQQLGLDAYVKQAKPKQRARGEHSTASEAIQADSGPGQSITCPVCGVFEGDEAAVSHHVATHFEA